MRILPTIRRQVPHFQPDEDCKTGNAVRLAFYENHIISLLPGEPRHIIIQFADSTTVTDKTKLVPDRGT